MLLEKKQYMLEKENKTLSHLSCLSLQTATMTSMFPRMVISMTRDRKQIRAIRFGMLSLQKRQKDTKQQKHISSDLQSQATVCIVYRWMQSDGEGKKSEEEIFILI